MNSLRSNHACDDNVRAELPPHRVEPFQTHRAVHAGRHHHARVLRQCSRDLAHRARSMVSSAGHLKIVTAMVPDLTVAVRLQRELIDTRLKLVPKMRTRKLVMLVIESGVLLWIVWVRLHRIAPARSTTSCISLPPQILLIIFQYGVDNGTVPGNLFTASSIQLIVSTPTPIPPPRHHLSPIRH